MSTATISIDVDAESARAFQEASSDDRRTLEVLLGLRLRELTAEPAKPLKVLMGEIGNRAAARGLTPEILESLLHAE